jgi:hypothetical protein
MQVLHAGTPLPAFDRDQIATLITFGMLLSETRRRVKRLVDIANQMNQPDEIVRSDVGRRTLV